jgi:6-phosphofructokinase
VEIMGHNAGWLALGAGLAGGADVILIPEIPYHIEAVVEALLARSRAGKRFSIVAIAEGAVSVEDAERVAAAVAAEKVAREASADGKEGKEGKGKAAKVVQADADDGDGLAVMREVSLKLAADLQRLSGLEARVTALGHLQRGGTPSPYDRILATRLGTAAVELVRDGVFGVMVAVDCDGWKPVPLEQVAGKLRTVPPDHPWVRSARLVGTSMGD